MENAMGWVWSPEGDGSIEESGPRDLRGGMGLDSPQPQLQNTRGRGPMDFKTAMALRLMLMEVMQTKSQNSERNNIREKSFEITEIKILICTF